MKQLKNVRHDYIRYANCWEDANVLLEGLEIKKTDKVVSIGSAGDNSFSILTQSPAIVVAVDINENQLHLIELKKAAFKVFNYKQFLAFLGFNASKDRLNLYASISDYLPVHTNTYWRDHTELIQNGVIHQGKFENYFKLFRTKILPWVQSNKNTNQLIAHKTANQQASFFHNKWNNWRWKLLLKIFFGKQVMGKYGRDPAFFKEVKSPIGEFMKTRATQHLSSVLCQTNPFTNYIMKGDFGTNLPHYAQEEHFETIKANIDSLTIHKGFLEDSFTKYGSFDKFNLSNIFEYMDEDTFQEVSNEIIQFSNPSARYVYWNLLVPRELDKTTTFIYDDQVETQRLSLKDKGFFYSGVHINYKI